MKIHKSKNFGDHHKFEAVEIVAKLKNKIIEEIASEIGFASRDQLYRVSSKISRVIDSLVVVYSCEYSIDVGLTKVIPEDRLKGEIIHNLSHEVAKSLIESTDIVVTEANVPWHHDSYLVSIPFINIIVTGKQIGRAHV